MRKRTFFLPAVAFTVMIVLLGCQEQPEQSSHNADETHGQLYMDVHRNIEGLTAEAVAGAHQKDLEIQGKYGVNYKSYWFDEKTGSVFCLVEAPSAELAARVHKEAHGLVADEITEVAEGH